MCSNLREMRARLSEQLRGRSRPAALRHQTHTTGLISAILQAQKKLPSVPIVIIPAESRRTDEAGEAGPVAVTEGSTEGQASDSRGDAPHRPEEASRIQAEADPLRSPLRGGGREGSAAGPTGVGAPADPDPDGSEALADGPGGGPMGSSETPLDPPTGLPPASSSPAAPAGVEEEAAYEEPDPVQAAPLRQALKALGRAEFRAQDWSKGRTKEQR